MKLKDGFILTSVAGQTVVFPCGDDTAINMMITLNETGRFLWTKLETGSDQEELVAALLGEYDISEQIAREHVALFIQKLNDNEFLK